MENRELDRLVAEKVMGWTTQDCAGMIWWLKPDVEPSIDNTHLENEQSFRPSSDIACAWEVVEKLRALPGYEVMQIQMRSTGGYAIMVPLGNVMACSVIAPTAPLAICLAALRAVGVEVPA